MAAESAGAPSQGGHNVPLVKTNGATPKPVEDVVNYSKRSIDDAEFFKDIPDDDLLESMDEDEPEKPKRVKPKLDRDPPKPAKRKPEPEPEPEEDEEDDEVQAADSDDEPEESDEPESDETEETKAWSVPEGKGSKDKPLTLKDLPGELFVELTVNGEKQVVDLKEAGKGYMRRQAFDQQVSKAKQGLLDAHDIAEKSVVAQERMKQQIENTRASFGEFIKDPKRVLAALFDNVPDKRRLVEVLIEDHEDTFEELSFAYAEFRQREDAMQKDGYQQARARRAQMRDQGRRQREQASLAEERRQIALERQRWDQEQAEKTKSTQDAQRREAATKAAWVALKPGLDAGLLALGLTDMTPELAQEVNVRLRLTRERTQAPLTHDDVKQAVLRAGKALDIQPGTPKRPAPAPNGGGTRTTARTERTPPKNASSDEFKGVPKSRQVRDINWYLKDAGI